MIHIFETENKNIKVKPRDVDTYLGYYGFPQGCSDEMIAECSAEFLSSVSFKACYARLPVKITDYKVDLGFSVFESKALAKNLKGCDEAFVFAATAGAASQRLIAKNSLISPVKGTVTDCVGSAATEEFCNILNQTLYDIEYLRPRFSPGYGDWSIAAQKEITEFLQAKKMIAVSLTDGFMLSPAKTVTAVIGISKEKNKCTGPGCMTCTREKCPYSITE